MIKFRIFHPSLKSKKFHIDSSSSLFDWLTLITKYPGHELDRFLENSSKIEHLVEKWYSKNSRVWHRPISGKDTQIWTSFPEIGPLRAPIFYKNWIGTHKKLMDEFSRNQSRSCSGNWNFEKILDEFSRSPSVSHLGKLKFRKNFWMSFPGFANKG